MGNIKILALSIPYTLYIFFSLSAVLFQVIFSIQGENGPDNHSRMSLNKALPLYLI